MPTQQNTTATNEDNNCHCQHPCLRTNKTVVASTCLIPNYCIQVLRCAQSQPSVARCGVKCQQGTISELTEQNKHQVDNKLWVGPQCGLRICLVRPCSCQDPHPVLVYNRTVLICCKVMETNNSDLQSESLSNSVVPKTGTSCKYKARE